MSSSIPSTPRRHSQSEMDTETSSLVSTASTSEQDSNFEDEAESSEKTPILATRYPGAKSTVSSGMDNVEKSALTQTIMTSSSPILSNRQTGEQKRARYRQARDLTAYQRENDIKKPKTVKAEKTVKQNESAKTPKIPKPDGQWNKFAKALTAEGKLILKNYDKNQIRELEVWLRTSPASLRELVIESAVIDDAGALAEALRGNTNITKLTLVGSNIGDQGAAALAEVLRDNTTVTTLVLNDCGVGDLGAAALAEAFRGNTTLTTLWLRGNSIGQDGAAALSAAFRGNATLTTLILDFNNIGDIGAAALAEAFKDNTTLATLDLGSNGIRAAGVAALAEAFKENTALTTLEISRNNIGTAGAVALADLLRGNSKLRTLRLFYSEIDSEGAVALAKALRDNRTLATLELAKNDIGDAGTLALADALRHNSTLTALDLGRSSHGENGLTALIAVLKVNTTLTSLDINYVGDKKLWKEIENLLERNRQRKNNLPFAEASLDLLVRHSPTLNEVDVPKELLPLLAEQLSSETLRIFGQEWQDTFRSPSSPVTTTTTNATVTTTTTTSIDSTLPTTRVTSPAAPAAPAAETNPATPSIAQPTATAAEINALLADPNPVVALSRWIDHQPSPAAGLNWVDPANGYTLLHYAVAAQQGAVVRSLLARGIDLQKADHKNQTAAQLAQARADSSSSQVVANIAALFR